MRHRAAPIALFAVSFSRAALADEPTTEPEPRAEEPIEVEVVGDRAERIQKIPGSFTVIGSEEIERAAPVNTAEMLRRVPGLYVREDTSGGSRLDIGVRGLDPGRSRRVLVLEDGMPLAINPYAEPDLYFTPQIERFSKIEVLKGSGSILYGPQTIGGVVSFSTRPAPSEVEGFASIDVGSFGYVRTIGRFGAPIEVDGLEPVRILGQLVVKRTDGARDQDSQDLDALTKVVFPITKQSRATIKLAAHHTSAVSEDVGMTREMFELDPKRGVLSPDSRMKLARIDGSVVLESRIDEGVTVKTLAYVSNTSRVWRRQLYDRIPDPDADYVRVAGDLRAPLGAIYFRDAARVLDRSYWVGGIEPRLTASFRTGVVGHTLDTGMRLLGEHATLEESTDPGGGVAGLLSTRDLHSTFALAAYLQDRMLFREWLVVTPGVRLEHASYLSSNEIRAGLASDIEGSASTTTAIPGIGVNVGLPEAHVFAGMHLGYAPPRVTEAIDANGETALLAPEESTNWEVGARVKPTDWIKGDATFFLQRFSNQIVPNTSLDGTTELVNGGATQSIGADASVEARIGRATKIDWDIDVGARGGTTYATFLGSAREGKRLPYAPAGTFSGTLDVDAPFGVGAGLAASWTGGFYTDEANTRQPDATGRVGYVDAYVELDASARYREQTTGLGASVTLKNLLDQPFVIARRPEGIWTNGFRQIILGLSWNVPSKR